MSDDVLESPVDRAAAEFSADRRRLDGTRSFWASSTTADGVQLVRWDEPDGQWVLASESAAGSWLDAVRNDAELAAIRPDEVTDYQAAAPAQLLTVLSAAGDGDATEEDWPFDVSEYDSDESPWHDEAPPRRLASVDDKRLFAESDGDPLPYQVHDDAVAGEPLAAFAWESVGGMTSGSGGWDLIQVTPRTAIAVPHGDTFGDGCAVRGFRFERSPGGMARMIASWLRHANAYCGGMEGGTALALETFDPSGMLTDAQRASWQMELDGLSGGNGENQRSSYYLCDAENTELRRTLSVEGSTYKRIADALADPIAGDWLRQSLADGDFQPLY